MKILIAGGAGFIGSNLSTRLLNEGHHIVCVDNFLTGSEENISAFKSNKNFSLIKHDITSPLNTSEKFDAVFHLASPASPNHHSALSYHTLPVETMLANTAGTFELLKLAKKNQAKFLFASTSEIYGDPQINPQVENYNGNVSTTGPRSVYDEAKRFGETITAHYWRKENVDARIVRIFNTFGPNMLKSDMRMVINFVNQALENKPITVFGDGLQTRSLCYIDDLVEGLIKLTFNPNTRAEIVNLGSVEEHSVLEYALMIKKITNSSSEIVFMENLPQDDPKVRKPDISKAKKLLNWEPKTPLETGLKKIINFFQKRKS